MNVLQKWQGAKEAPHDDLKQHPRHKKKESLTDCNVYNLDCFAHPLQLCIQDAIFKQKSVREWITPGDGSLAVILRIWLQWLPRFSIQGELCLSYNQLEEDMTTCWNWILSHILRLLQNLANPHYFHYDRDYCCFVLIVLDHNCHKVGIFNS